MKGRCIYEEKNVFIKGGKNSWNIEENENKMLFFFIF